MKIWMMSMIQQKKVRPKLKENSSRNGLKATTVAGLWSRKQQHEVQFMWIHLANIRISLLNVKVFQVFVKVSWKDLIFIYSVIRKPNNVRQKLKFSPFPWIWITAFAILVPNDKHNMWKIKRFFSNYWIILLVIFSFFKYLLWEKHCNYLLTRTSFLGPRPRLPPPTPAGMDDEILH